METTVMNVAVSQFWMLHYLKGYGQYWQYFF